MVLLIFGQGFFRELSPLGRKINLPFVRLLVADEFIFYFGVTMRIEIKEYKQYPWYLKPFFWRQQRTYGQLLKPALAWAREPKLFAAVAALYGVLDRRSSPVSPVLRSMITVRVSQLNWCNF